MLLKMVHVHLVTKLKILLTVLLNCHRYAAAIRIELVNNFALISRITTGVVLYDNTEFDIEQSKCIFDEVHHFYPLSHRSE